MQPEGDLPFGAFAEPAVPDLAQRLGDFTLGAVQSPNHVTAPYGANLAIPVETGNNDPPATQVKLTKVTRDYNTENGKANDGTQIYKPDRDTMWVMTD